MVRGNFAWLASVRCLWQCDSLPPGFFSPSLSSLLLTCGTLCFLCVAVLCSATLQGLGGDATETSELLRSVVPSLKHLPGGGQVYYHPSLSRQHRVQLVQALQLLYSDGEKMCDSTAQTPAAAPQRAAKPTVTGAIIAAAAAAKAAPATAGAGAPEPATSSAAGVGGPANAKRARTEQPAQPDKRRRLPVPSAPVCATTDSV